jgi:hypothetical protein
MFLAAVGLLTMPHLAVAGLVTALVAVFGIGLLRFFEWRRVTRAFAAKPVEGAEAGRRFEAVDRRAA